MAMELMREIKAEMLLIKIDIRLHPLVDLQICGIVGVTDTLIRITGKYGDIRMS